MALRPWLISLTILSSVSLVVLSGCSSGSGDDSADGDQKKPVASTTTANAEDRATDAAYRERGKYQVGVVQMSLDDGRRVVAWYPADDSAADTPKEMLDLAGFLNESMQAMIPPEMRPVYTIDAHPDAKSSEDGPFPVVLFSHGYGGYPEQSADLVTHLASWGFVVVAPDHVERSLTGLIGGAAEGVPPRTDPEVLRSTLDAAIAASKDAASPLHNLVDSDHVAVTGHSAGAAAAYKTAMSDDRVDAFISYSVAIGEDKSSDDSTPSSESAPGTGSAPKAQVPDVPGMIMAGTTDGVIPLDATQAVYQAMNPPKYLVEIDGAGHLVFADVCLIGKEQGGLVALVRQIGLELPENLLRLAKDGCEPGDLDPVKAFPAIDHLSVAFLRYSLGIDKEPVGLDPAVTESFKGVEVSLTADPG